MSQTRPTTREAFAILREQREPQVQMAEMVARCIADATCGIVEAGTGVGKSFGYLIPAVAAGQRIAVATFTLALQDQLMKSDLPFLQRRMREVFGINFRAAMLKGASNYLCARRLAEAEEEIPAAVARWGHDTTTGDMADAPAEADDRVRDAIKIDLDDCGRTKCPFFTRCHYQVAKQRAKDADVLVVNHAILSRGLENPFLLDLSGFDAVIVDEAHQFEDVARDAFGGRLSPGALSKFFTKVEGVLVDAENIDGWKAVRDPFRAAWKKVLAGPSGQTSWLMTHHASGQPFDDEKILAPVDWIQHNAEAAVDAFRDVSAWVADRTRDEPEHAKIGRMVEGIREFFTTLHSGDVIAVVERKIARDAEYATVAVETYPLNVGPRLKRSLYDIVPTIYTSATISAGGDFTLARRALGLADDAPTFETGSPFDYPNQALLYVPRGIEPVSGRSEDPRVQAYQATMNAEIERLLAMSQGRAFVLFTSARAMKDAFYQRRHAFPSRWQEPGVPKNQLIEWFKSTPRAVLYATASFWEGVSIEGERLSMVIIDKVPFPPPNDPIFKAKEARLGDKKAFFILSVPSAIIKLKQGFGRLVRTQADRGVVAILDSRIHGKGYGKQILRALPPATLVDTLDAETAARFLDAPGGEAFAGGMADEAPAPVARRSFKEIEAEFWPDAATPPAAAAPMLLIQDEAHLAEVLDAAEAGPAAVAQVVAANPAAILAALPINVDPAMEAALLAWEAVF